MPGIEVGIDRGSTLALYRSATTSEQRRGVLRSVLAGAIRTHLHQARLVDSPICPHCKLGCVEDAEHMWWACPAWGALRLKYKDHLFSFRESWPSCFQRCGLMPLDHDAFMHVELEASDSAVNGNDDWDERGHVNDETANLRGQTPQLDVRTRMEEWVLDGKVVVYTDGACRNSQHERLRKSGYGCFWGQCQTRNIAKPLAGVVQTNQRAEMQAAVAMLEIEERPVEIRTDSKYVLRGVETFSKLRRHGWLDTENGDLWQQLDSLLEARDRNSVVFVKVEGHSKWSDVAAGKVSYADKQGNDAADALARKGAAAHVLVEGFVAKVRTRRRLAMAVQNMMCGIVEARNARQACAPVVVDCDDQRDSEDEEVIDFSSDEHDGHLRDVVWPSDSDSADDGDEPDVVQRGRLWAPD